MTYELKASDLVAAKIRKQRTDKGWTARQLAERCPTLSPDIIQNIENGRPGPDGQRRRAVTVDEIWEISAALETVAHVLLPDFRDMLSPEGRAQWDQAEEQRKTEATQMSKSMDSLLEGMKAMRELGAKLQQIPKEAVIAIERDGKLVSIDAELGFLDELRLPAVE